MSFDGLRRHTLGLERRQHVQRVSGASHVQTQAAAPPELTQFEVRGELKPAAQFGPGGVVSRRGTALLLTGPPETDGWML